MKKLFTNRCVTMLTQGVSVSKDVRNTGVKKYISCILVSLFLLPASINAQNFTLTSNGDSNAANPAVSALDASGFITLRSAIQASTAQAGPHIITIPAAIGASINLTLGQMTVGNAAAGNNITVNGPGMNLLTVNQTTENRIFSTGTGAVTFLLQDITLNYNGPAVTPYSGGGGAIIAGGAGAATTLINCRITNFQRQIGNGGAISASSSLANHSLTITNCIFTNNKCGGAGGAVSFNSQGGTATITGCIFDNNHTGPVGVNTGGDGGAVSVTGGGSGGTYFIERNTFLNNQVENVTGHAGAVMNTNGTLTLRFNRFIGNTCANVAFPPLANIVGQAGGATIHTTIADNNWWGVNTGPGPNDATALAVGAVMTLTKWLQLKTTASPNPICNTPAGLGNTTTVTTSFLSNSANEAIALGNLTRLIGLPVVWGPTTLGSLSGQQGTIQSNGTATTLFTSNGTGGTATVNAQVDNIPAGETAPARANIIVNTLPTVTNPVNTTACVGGTATFTSTITGTPVPTITWYKGGTPIVNGPTGTGATYSGATTNTLTITNVQPGDAGNYNVDAVNHCGTATSATAALIVNAVTGGTVGSDQTICTGGDPAAFTETVASTGSGALSYQWQSSTTSCAAGFSNIGSATGLTYDPPSGLAVTTFYRRVTISTLNAVPCTANSNCITVTVNAVTGGTVAADQTVCSGGDPAAFTQTVASTGSGALTYQWQSSTTDCISGFSNIGSATTTTYDPPAGLLLTTYYRRVTISTQNGVPCTANSNCITVTVNAVTGGNVAGDQNVCSGGDPATFTETVASTGSGALSYQWQSSTTDCISGFSNIGGATGTLYNPPAGLLLTTYYRRVTISTQNGVPCTANSNCITVTVNAVTGGTVAADQTVCSGGDPAAFTQTVTSTGSGALTHQWQSSTTDCISGFSNIGGATAITYDPPAGLLVTTYYRRVTTSTLSGLPCTANSNCITVTVNNVTGGTVAADQNVCSGGDPAAFTQTVASTGSGALTYQWQSSTTDCISGFSNIGGAMAISYDPPAGLTQSTYYRRVTTSTLNGVPCTANSNCITVTNDPNNTITLTSTPGTDNQSILINTPIINITYATTSATGATFGGLPPGVSGNWVANVVTISGSPTSAAASPYNYTVTLTGGCGSVSATGSITVSICNILNQTVSASPSPICTGSSSTITVGASENGINYTLRNDADDYVIAGPTPGTGPAINFPTGTLTNTTTYNVLAETDKWSVYLNGGQAGFVIPQAPSLDVTNNFTIEGWIKPDGTSGFSRLFNKSQAYALGLCNGQSAICFTRHNAGDYSITYAFTSGQWYHIACTYSSGTVEFFVNGASIGTVGSVPGILVQNQGAQIGSESSSFHFFKGNIDNVRLWNSVRTVTEIAANQQEFLTSSGNPTLAASWWISEGSGVTTKDFTTNAVNATSLAGTWQADSPIPSCSIQLSDTPTVTVNQINTITLTSVAATTNQTVCINTPIINIIYSTTGATGATFSGLPAGVTGNWAANVVTISGAPSTTVGSPFNYMVTLTGGCGTISAGGTITVNPNNTITLSSVAATTSQTVCINTAIINIIYTTTGATGATFSGLPAGVTGNWTANVVTISGSPTTTAGSPFNYMVTLTGGCGTISAGGTITVNPNNTITLTSSLATTAQTVCINTPIANITYNTTGATGATFSGLPAGVTGNWAANVVTISGSPNTTAGSPFNYMVTLTGGCGIITSSGTITVNPNNTVTLTSAVATTNQNVQVNTPIISITYATTGATGATFSGLPPGVTGNWAANVISINGSPNTIIGSPFNYTVTLTGGCGIIAASGTIAVYACSITLTSAIGTNAQTVCNNTPISNITYATTGATGATFSNLPAGVNGSWAANAVTISGMPTVAGNFNYTVTLTGGGCGSVSTAGTITVNQIPIVIPTPPSQTICNNTATSIALSSNVPGTTFSWVVQSTSGSVSGQLGGSGANISQTLANGGATAATVTYRITPTGPAPTNCVGPTTDVTVTISPSTAITCPASFSVNSNTDGTGNCSGTAAWTHPSETAGACIPITMTMSIDGNTPVPVTPGGPASAVLSVGIHSVAYLASDGKMPTPNTTTCSFMIAVVDNELPTITCPATQSLVLDSACSATLPNYTGLAISGDNCVVQGISQAPTAGTSVSGAGNMAVTLTVTDINGLSSSCPFIVTKLDATPPSIACPFTQTLVLGANCSATLPNYTGLAISSDNCAGLGAVTQSPVAGTIVSGAGNMTVTLSVTDGNGLMNSCSFSVTKLDNTAPTVQCFNQTINFNGETIISLNTNDLVLATDGCGVQNISLSPNSVSNTQVGQTVPVLVTVTDINNNTATCTSQITASGLPPGWSQSPNGVGCTDGNYIEYNTATQVWTATSTNCYYASPFTSDETAFAQRTLCGDGSITAQVTGISGTALGWAGVVMRENNAAGAKKAQLTTNMAGNQSRREFRLSTNGAAIPQQFMSLNRFWLRIVRSGNQFAMYNSPNGILWYPAGAQTILMGNCIQIGLVATNYTPNSTVTATFANVSFTGVGPMMQPTNPDNNILAATANSQPNFNVYPNPTSGELNIDLKEYIGKNVQIELYSLEGKLMQLIRVDEVLHNTETMLLDRYAGGTYFVKLKSAGLPDVTKRILFVKE